MENKVKEKRTERNLSMYQLAKMVGVEWHTIQNIEKGADFKVSTLLKIASALNVPINELI